MRFLIFNAAVVAALIYLLSADRLYDMADRVEDAARDSAPAEAAIETAPTETAAETVPPAPAPDAAAPSGAPSGGTAQAAFVRDLPPVDDPAVAKRRAEVLDGIAAFDSAPEVTLAEGETLMGPEERLRELYRLAEEMELLFVTKLTR
ncbi:MAG: hypothetical protein IIC53_11755 [Proteobacteria bacterium]|nr:hypothetical protein [Pseudomonadota bacterium]